jgi:RNA polymerase sigma factor (TIGR02999 family)
LSLYGARGFSVRAAAVDSARIRIAFIATPTDITLMLRQFQAGDDAARDRLMELVYATLHRIARGHLRNERSGHTLQPTALVHEGYLKLFGGSEIEFVDRVHFFALMSRAMRRILVDHARARDAARRGADAEQVPLDEAIHLDRDVAASPIRLLELDLALDALAHESPPLARLIEMRYFGGMTAEESAEALGRSVHVVRHDLRFAHAWLRRQLAAG